MPPPGHGVNTPWHSQAFPLNYPPMNSEIVWPGEEPVSSLFECQTNPPQRILLAAADDDLRHVNAEVLLDSGYDVDAAEDGAVAWDALRLKSYDLLIFDNNMPKLSGVDLLKNLHAAQMALPVILLSETMPTEEWQRQSWLPIKARLHKPCTLAKLLGTVGKVLRANDGVRAEMVPPPAWQSPSPFDRLRP
jgi:DNA-binding response OmpR family regulator